MAAIRKVDGAFAETRVGDEVVLMNVDTGEFHAVKGTGLAIWQLIDGMRGPTEIVATLTARYAVDALQCQADVDRFLAGLEKAGFVRNA